MLYSIVGGISPTTDCTLRKVEIDKVLGPHMNSASDEIFVVVLAPPCFEIAYLYQMHFSTSQYSFAPLFSGSSEIAIFPQSDWMNLQFKVLVA